MAAQKSGKNAKKQYVIIARSQETMKEGFAVVNAGGRMARRIKFETPVYLTDTEVNAIKRQKDPVQIDKEISVYEIMEKYKIPQEKAGRLAQKIQQDPSMGGKSIDFVSKYIVTPI